MTFQNFYFTFGSAPGFPFNRGWVEIQAPDISKACDIFNVIFPPRRKGVLNCAFVYTEDQFKTTGMYAGKYPEEKCRMKISVSFPN